MKKVGSVLILVVLIIVVIVLTVGEKYAERQQDQETEIAASTERLEWETRLNRMFDARWRDLSSRTRAVLDSLATATLTAGVSAESLLVAIEALSEQAAARDTVSDSLPHPDRAVAKAEQEPQVADPPDSIMVAYRTALDALPDDLSSYERRIALDEVRYLIRARFGLSEARIDSLLISGTG
jgi:hypothetical protein